MKIILLLIILIALIGLCIYLGKNLYSENVSDTNDYSYDDYEYNYEDIDDTEENTEEDGISSESSIVDETIDSNTETNSN